GVSRARRAPERRPQRRGIAAPWADLRRRPDENRHRPQDARSKAHEPVPVSFLEKKFKPIGACSGHRIASLFLPGHLIPATFFNGFSPLPATYLLECFQFLFMVRLLQKLGDADRRLTRQYRLAGPRLGRAGGCPATPRKPDDRCDDCPKNEAPHSILNFRCRL